MIVNYLNDKHQDEDEDESGVEVGDVERCSQTSNQSVASDNSSQQHSSQLRTQISNQTNQIITLISKLLMTT